MSWEEKLLPKSLDYLQTRTGRYGLPEVLSYWRMLVVELGIRTVEDAPAEVQAQLAAELELQAEQNQSSQG